jgi:phage-related protein
MSKCRFYDYVETNGNNPIRVWLNSNPAHDCAKIDYRLIQMEAMPRESWSEKWISKYRGTELFELRISGKKIEYRPLGNYHGQGKFVILAGAIEKGGKLKKSDVETAQRRLENLKGDAAHARLHQFDDPENLEEDEE